ncbi:hypothetical protein [Micrococcus luteus]|uniref:hypothetical protein n=1 Tax=Micrococcus luteus TaxID=1270 RepID=UPI0011AB45EE|nr:hypothetical protein [Micrococcus luteus]MBM4595323.1 hypothetical protein [Prescottella equi]
MRAAPVDPRYATELDDHPSYRVDFRTGDSASDEWRLTGASGVAEVLEWAAEHAGGRSVVVYAECILVDGVRLVRLSGQDPTASS